MNDGLTFLQSRYVKLAFLVLFLIYLISAKVFILLFTVYLGVLFLFRNKSASSSNIGFFGGFGLCIDQAGEVEQVDYTSGKIIVADKGKSLIVHIKPRLTFIKPIIWVKAGDLIENNALVGYLPFGGKIAIEREKINVNFKDKNNE